MLAEVGLDAKAGWLAGAVLYGTAGLATAGLQLMMPESIPTGVFYLGLFTLVIGALCMPGAIYLTNANWATHARLLAGLSIFLAGAIVAGPAREAWVLLPLFVLVTPAYLYGGRYAMTYAVLATTMTAVALITTNGPARIAHALVTVGAIWMIVVAFMVAESTTRKLARLNRRLAYTDPLTGLANTRRLRTQLSEALAKGFGPGNAFALFAIDLDNFKLVNDTFDHTTGDRVLRAVAEELSAEVDHFDLVARRGGDEFSVLVVDIDGRDLDSLARSLGDAIIRARRRACPQITPSGSVAYVRSQAGDSIASILQRADDELHHVKRAFHAADGESGEGRIVVMPVVERPADALPSRAAREVRVSTAVDEDNALRTSDSGTRVRLGYDAVREWVRSLDPRWWFSAVALLPAAVAIAMLTIAGALEPLPPQIGLVAACGYLALSALGVYAARRHWNVEIMNFGFPVATAITCWIVWKAEESGTALIDILPVLVLYAFYFLGAKQGAGLFVFAMGAYAAFAIAGDYQYGIQRAVIGVVAVGVCAALVLKVRNVTMRFTRQHAELSEIDALTGLANVRSLQMRVGDTVAAAQAGTVRPVIVTIDLDKFKLVNDRYNHTIGDRVIEAVARAISETVRNEETVARRGGDEFFVLLRDPGEGQVEIVSERLRSAIEHARKRICPDLPATASVGAVRWRLGESAERFMSRADAAMHDEKLQTRSRGYHKQTA
ncbi:MAG: GGDEF domain-containing protein [Actinobacteria bacterium]|nr:GGDEF domain-containing protein [Actinomycetota bacterium]